MVSMKETKTQYRGYIMTSKPILYIVIPCYNEEKVLPETEPLFSVSYTHLTLPTIA